VGGHIERIIERVLFASRWLMAPLYLGLAALLVLLVIQFFVEWGHLVPGLPGQTEHTLIVGALSLVDLVLVASLIVMVMLSGFENFVAKIDLGEAEHRLSWLMKLDTGSIKVKILTSIVAISAINLLKVFLNIDETADDKLVGLVIVHLTFVATALLLAVLDRIATVHKEH
jgi:uncharacterized protein (TIGR00645 family)